MGLRARGVGVRSSRQSPGGYHQHFTRLAQSSERIRLSDDAQLVHIRAIHAKSKGSYGWPRVWKELLGRGILQSMNFNAVIERDLETGLLVGSVPGIPGAHTQGETIEEVRDNLAEVIELLQAQNALNPESEFIATTTLMVA